MLALGLVSLLTLAVVATADVFLLDFTGYDWTVGGDLGEPGSCYEAIGFVPNVNPDFLNFDYGDNEYTFHLQYSCFVDAEFYGTTAVYYYGPFGPLATNISIYCDLLLGGTAGDYGEDPPNATNPSTFVDGECVLGGDFQGDLIFVVDLTTGDGSMQGVVNWNAGTQLGNIPPESREMSLVLAGVNYDPVDGPQGYLWQITGTIDIKEPVAVEPTRWGNLKARFVGGN
jgi:hypothetical protein